MQLVIAAVDRCTAATFVVRITFDSCAAAVFSCVSSVLWRAAVACVTLANVMPSLLRIESRSVRFATVGRAVELAPQSATADDESIG